MSITSDDSAKFSNLKLRHPNLESVKYGNKKHLLSILQVAYTERQSSRTVVM